MRQEAIWAGGSAAARSRGPRRKTVAARNGTLRIVRPGERVVAIKGIAERLASERWADIRLTLRQFDVEAKLNESRDAYAQLLDALDVDDETLADLEEFLFPGVDEGPGADDEAGDGPWAEGRFRLFVSHTHRHMAFASSLRRALASTGIDAFVAHDQIEPTREWEDRLELALKTCDALVAILTPDFVKSKWCDQEVGYCIARGVLIIPLGLGENPHGFIGKYQRMSAREDEDAHDVAMRLFHLLTEHEKTAELMGPTIAMQIVVQYAESNSFDDARKNFEQLRAIPRDSWTPELAEIVERAPDENSQIAFAKVGREKMSEAASRYLDDVLDRLPSVAQGQIEEEDVPF
jgi:TIR domain